MIKPVAAMGVVFTVFGMPSVAQAISPEGIWWPTNQESRYEFSFCRGDNERLCARLIWIREDQKDARNVKFINTYLFTGLRPKGVNKWKGGVQFEGIRGKGTVVLNNDNHMSLKACALFQCGTIELSRAPAEAE